jgi:hypothetical protein
MTVLSATYPVPLVNPVHFVSGFVRIKNGKDVYFRMYFFSCLKNV